MDQFNIKHCSGKKLGNKSIGVLVLDIHDDIEKKVIYLL